MIDAYNDDACDWESVNSLFVFIATFVEEKTKQQLQKPKKKKVKK